MTAILVAIGAVQQQIFDGVKTEPVELGRAFRSHACEIADRGRQSEFWRSRHEADL